MTQPRPLARRPWPVLALALLAACVADAGSPTAPRAAMGPGAAAALATSGADLAEQ